MHFIKPTQEIKTTLSESSKPTTELKNSSMPPSIFQDTVNS